MAPIYKNIPPNENQISFPIIAPFWSDINTLVGGQIYYRESFCSCDFIQAQSEIANIYSNTFNPSRLYIITWHQVAAFYGGSAVNNLSLIHI